MSGVHSVTSASTRNIEPLTFPSDDEGTQLPMRSSRVYPYATRRGQVGVPVSLWRSTELDDLPGRPSDGT